MAHDIPIRFRIHDHAWKAMRVDAAIKSRLDRMVDLVGNQLRDRHRHTDANRHLSGQLFKRRINQAIRITYTVEGSREKGFLLTFWEVLSHEEGEAAHDGYDVPADGEFHLLETEPEVKPLRPAPKPVPLFRRLEESDYARLSDPKADLEWWLDSEQVKFAEEPGPVLVTGNAGSGKTTIALFRFRSESGLGKRRLFVTYTRSLRDHAERLHARLGGKTGSGQFLTFTQLCQQLIPNAATRFADGKQVSFAWFARLNAVRTIRIAPEEIWEEIRGVIRGDGRLMARERLKSGLHYLSLDEYLNDLVRSQSLFEDPADKKGVYQAFEAYEKEKHRQGLWDDLDLTFGALCVLGEGESVEGTGRYDEIVCDEVQDLTIVQAALVSELARSPAGLYFAGDDHQSIHPSRFQWERLQDRIYAIQQERLQHWQRKSSKPRRLTTNYRSTRPIVELSNALMAWRAERFSEIRHDIEAVRPGNPAYYADVSLLRALATDSRKPISARIMVVVPDETMLAEATQLFGVGRCLTVHDAKGLEREFVIAWRFLDQAEDSWLSLVSQPAHRKVSAGRLRYGLNCLNVAITRPTDRLFVSDSTFPDLPFLSALSTQGVSEAAAELFQLATTEEEFRHSAIELEQKGIYKQAAADYESAGEPESAARCLAKFHLERRDFELAARKFEEAGLYDDAFRAWEEAAQALPALLKEAFRCLLRVSTDAAGTRAIQDYLDDAKRLRRIPAQVLALTEAVTERGIDPNLAVKYMRARFATNRSRLETMVQDLKGDIKRQGWESKRVLPPSGKAITF